MRIIYEVANSLAIEEGLKWVQVKYAQDTMDKVFESATPKGDIKKNRTDLQKIKDTDRNELPTLLQSQFYEFVQNKKEEHIQRMIILLELYSNAKWARSTNKAEKE
jgi:hypothetical protein